MTHLEYLQHPKTFEAELKKNRKIDHALTCQSYPDAVILPYIDSNQRSYGGVVDSKGRFVEASNFNEQFGGAYQAEIIEYRNQSAVFIGNLVYPAWGHAITDDLKYLWWLLTDDFKKLRQEQKPILVCIKSKYIDTPLILSTFLTAMGIEDSSSFQMIETPTRFLEVYVPEPSFLATKGKMRFWATEFYETIQAIKAHFANTQEYYDKIYLSRSKQKGHRDFGESCVEHAFKQAGYHVIHPEKLSIAEQISYISHANVMAATEGSISHNAVFMKQGATLIVLRKTDFVNQYQLAVNEINRLNVFYIDTHLSFLNNKKTPIVGPFFIYVNDKLARFLNTKRHFPLIEFVQYIRWSIFHRDILDRI